MTGSLTPVPTYLSIAPNEQQYVARFQASDPVTKSDLAYFQANAAKITSPDALLKNYRVLQVVLNAFNMSKDINSAGLLKKLMTENPSDKNSVAQKLANPNYLRFAQYMSGWSPPPFSNPKVVDVIAGQFATNSFEQAEGQQADGLQQALYFTRNISNATTINQLMSDPTLLNVIVTGMGLPQQFGLMDYDQQVTLLSKTVDLSKFTDPAYVNKFVQKYLVMNQMNNSGDNSQPTGLLALFGAGTDTSGNDLLSALFPDSGTTDITGLLLSRTA